MLNLKPRDKFLMNFCDSNLFVYEGEATVLSGRTFLEKLQYELIKRRVRKLVYNVSVSMFRDKNFDVDKIRDFVDVSPKELWDVALVYIAVKHMATLPSERAMQASDGEVGSVLALYLDFIEAERLTPDEVLGLKLQKLRIKCAYDLDFAAERIRRGMQ